ncbi:hypothetical protein TKK_0013545 [Trichogramma kaykai]|uniref:Glycosyl transferase CAP10 domain-containing protein n=1 Tax=Trichogramma kaykai TaxID=54128 RepID=A0ABD2WJ07_9HYME
MKCLIRIAIVALLCTNYCLGDTCSSESCPSESKTNRYSKDANTKYAKYYAAIEKAEANYIECNSSGCKCFADVMSRDLDVFSKRRIDQTLIQSAKSRGTLYQIINGQLYRQKDCMFPSRCAGIEYFLTRVITNTTNLELVINTRDYPQSGKHFGEPLPIFSFSKTPDYNDIMYPAWAFWAGGPAISLYPNGLGRWDTHRVTLDDARQKFSWDEKKDVAFFRGSRTSSERDNLVLLSRAKPELVEAQYTKNQAWKSEKDTLNMPPVKEVALEKHCEYKYLFNYRGVAASFRHKHLFLCGSLVFHVGDEWKEFYYDALKPWIHYIPVQPNASPKELENLIRFAQDNDAIAKRIAERGRDFIFEKLTLEDVMCYWRRLIRRYAKLVDYKPTMAKDMILIKKSKSTH